MRVGRGHAAASRPVPPVRAASRLACLFAASGALWILLSHRAVASLFSDPEVVTLAQHYKGWAFVVVCSTLLFVLLRREFVRRAREELSLRQQAECLDAANVLVREMSGHIRFWNSGAQVLYGWKREEAIGRLAGELLRTKYPRPLEEIHADLLRHGVWSGELTHTRKGGDPVVVASHWVLRRDEEGGLDSILEVDTDVSSLRETEETLRAVSGALRAVVIASPAAIITLNASGEVEMWNPAAERMFGWLESEVRGKSLSYIPPGQWEEFSSLFRRVLAGEAFMEIEARRLRRDGSTIDVSISTAPTHDPRGRVSGALALILDITESRRAREEIRRVNAELELRVEERTRQLREINAELEAFGYTISHDLRAPLRAMDGFATALLNDCGDILDGKHRDYAERIVAAACRMERLIEGLLSYSRLARDEIALVPVSLDAAVDTALREMQEEISRARAVIRVQNPMPVVSANELVLVRVLENLISNAIKYVRAGIRPEVGIRAACAGRRVRLSIRDNGIGVDQRWHGRIFEAFERLHGEDDYPGSGIGLAVVRRGTERMGGSCGLASQPGRGSEFWIELVPASPPEPG